MLTDGSPGSVVYVTGCFLSIDNFCMVSESVWVSCLQSMFIDGKTLLLKLAS